LVPSSTTSSNAAPSASTPAESTLAQENRLFKAAAEASRQGDTNGALAQLDQLLSQHPRSPLAQTAQVRKFRLLAKAGRPEAAQREARRYLSQYPTGFAVIEAEALANGSASAEPTAP
jgi:outer membrane protein assembly factor BamD (BamD/ComL family)